MNTNKNVLDGVLSRILAADGIKLQEAANSVPPGQGPKTHFRVSELIDGIWYTSYLELRGAAYLPFDADMRDDWLVLANFIQALRLGVNLPHIVQPTARRLSSWQDT